MLSQEAIEQEKAIALYRQQSKLKYNQVEIEVKEIFVNQFHNGIETIIERLKNWDSVEAFFLGRHWKDSPKNNYTVLVDPHWHIYIKYKENKRITYGTLINKVNGVKLNEDNYESVRLDTIDNNIIKIDFRNFRSIKSSFAKCYDYLYHIGCKEYEYKYKHLYTKEEMKPYFYCYGVAEEDIKNWDECQFDESSRLLDDEQLINEYIEKVSSGELDYYDFYIDPEDRIPHRDFQKVERALKPIFARISAQQLDKYNREGFRMNVIYIYGDTETCKSLFAKKYAYATNKSVYITNNSDNPFDDYKGQKIVIYNDWRPKDLSFNRLLNLLDPYNHQMTKARYHDIGLACETLIITTDKDIDTTFVIDEKDKEEVRDKNHLNQLKRRCALTYKFEDDKIIEYHWDNKLKRYTMKNIYENTIKQEIAKEDRDTKAIETLSSNISSTMSLQVINVPKELEEMM